MGMAYLFIAHDLAVIGQVSDRVAVMYLGQIIETATRDELFVNPLHPYTVALMSAVTVPDPHHRRRRQVLTGEVPSPVDPPPSCRFHTRCPRVMEICKTQPPFLCISGSSHQVYCHLYD
jgi:oligopeptide/dipeptide ABC transporter ATP-binding protein